MGSADRTPPRQLHPTGIGQRLSYVLEWGSCHIFVDLSVCVTAKWTEWRNPWAKQNIHASRERPASPPPPTSCCGPVFLTQSSRCCLRPMKRYGVGTVGQVSDLSLAGWNTDSPPRTAGQIDVITKAARSDTHSSKCSVAGNNKKIKATSVAFSLNRSWPNRFRYRPLEIYDCTTFHWNVCPVHVLWLYDKLVKPVLHYDLSLRAAKIGQRQTNKADPWNHCVHWGQSWFISWLCCVSASST